MKESTRTEIRQSLIATMSGLDHNDDAESRKLRWGDAGLVASPTAAIRKVTLQLWLVLPSWKFESW
jgi:hypothetical protein